MWHVLLDLIHVMVETTHILLQYIYILIITLYIYINYYNIYIIIIKFTNITNFNKLIRPQITTTDYKNNILSFF